MQFFGTRAQHLDQAGLVQHRVGVRRADEAGHPAGDGRRHLAFQHAGVFMPGLAQAGGEIDQARQHPAAARIHGAAGREVARQLADAQDAARRDGDVGHLVAAGGWVDHPAVLNQ